MIYVKISQCVNKHIPAYLQYLVFMAAHNNGQAIIFHICGFYLSSSLWPPCVADADIVFSSCGFFYIFLLSSFSSPTLSRPKSDVYRTATHGVTLVRI